MTTRKQAVAALARLHGTYCPLEDKLVAAAEAANTPAPMVGIACTSTVGLPTATTDNVILAEQGQKESILVYAEIAWGPAAKADLDILHPAREELTEIAPILGLRLDGPLQAALIGCHVRGRRLGRYLRESPPEPVHDMMHKLAARYLALAAVEGGSPGLKRRVAEEFGTSLNTLYKALSKNRTVHKSSPKTTP